MSEAADVPLQRALDALSTYCFGGRTLAETLEQVGRFALEAVSAAEFIAFIVSLERRPFTTFFTDDRALELDEVQYAADSGPCLDAFRDGVTYSIPCMRDETRWPEFARAAIARGVHSTLSVPLTAAGVHLGAMNLYSSHERSFGDDETTVAARFASPAAAMLANAAAYSNALALGQDLAQAMESRAVIEQAKGVIMGATRCSAEAAFDVLVKQSQQQNVKLRDIAQEIVRNVERQTG